MRYHYLHQFLLKIKIRNNLAKYSYAVEQETGKEKMENGKKDYGNNKISSQTEYGIVIKSKVSSQKSIQKQELITAI